MEKIITCTVCPMGCEMTVVGEGANIESVTGYTCPRGKKYAESEFVCPERILTTTVKTKGAEAPLLAVRSETPMPRDKVEACIKALKDVTVEAPAELHSVICEDILGTGVNIIASAALKAAKQ